MRRGTPRPALFELAIALALAAGGCVSKLDMASAYDPSRAATTIPYSSVRGARRFPDYEAVGRSILTGVDPAAAGSAAAKTGKPKRGPK